MDTDPTDLSDKKDSLYKELLDLMIQSLQNGTLSANDSDEASRFIIDNFEKARDIHYLKVVIEELCENWPSFKPALLSFEKQSAEGQDQAKIEDTQQSLEELKNQNS